MVLPLLLSHVARVFLTVVCAVLLQLVVGALRYCVLVKTGVILHLLGRLQVLHVSDLSASEWIEELEGRPADLLVHYDRLDRLLH